MPFSIARDRILTHCLKVGRVGAYRRSFVVYQELVSAITPPDCLQPCYGQRFASASIDNGMPYRPLWRAKRRPSRRRNATRYRQKTLRLLADCGLAEVGRGWFVLLPIADPFGLFAKGGLADLLAEVKRWRVAGKKPAKNAELAFSPESGRQVASDLPILPTKLHFTPSKLASEALLYNEVGEGAARDPLWKKPKMFSKIRPHAAIQPRQGQSGRFAKMPAAAPDAEPPARPSHPDPVPFGTEHGAAIPSAPAVPAAPEATAAPCGSSHIDAQEEENSQFNGPSAPILTQTGGDAGGPRSGPLAATPSVPKGTPSASPKTTRLHLTLANLTAEERALLSAEVLATAARHPAPWITNGFLRGSLAHARERVAKGLPPWEPPQHTCGLRSVAAASAGMRQKATGAQRQSRKPQRLIIRPPPRDETPATPEWLREHIGRFSGLEDVPVCRDAANGYPRSAWRQAVAVLIKQERSYVRDPAAFVSKGAREIAGGGQHDPRKSSLYSVMRGWPRELAAFAQVESRMPGWEAQYGGRHLETE